jgi:hypothetical protein
MNTHSSDNWERRLEENDTEMERRFRSLDDRIDTALGDTPMAPARTVNQPIAPVTPLPEWNAVTRQWAGLFIEDPTAFFVGTDSELNQICAYVLNAPHVTGNAHYLKVAQQTRFVSERDDPTVNAYATHGRSGKQPEIRLLGGAVTFARLCGALRAVSGDGGRHKLNAMWPVVGRTVLEGQGKLPPAKASEVLTKLDGQVLWQDEALMRRAVAHSAGMIAGIIAHELGHLALGHTLGRAANLEVSRNQEREADSFASSVISTSVFSDPLVEGMLLWELAWTWTQHLVGEEVATTHPVSRERLLDFIRANETVAASLGLTLETVEELLPK